jgi:peptidoglycan/LPS O-acetylase OafA/YrhL
VAVLNVVAIPLGGDGPTLPLWGRVVTKMMMSLVCGWVGMEGGFVLSGVFMTSLYRMAGIDVLHADIHI